MTTYANVLLGLFYLLFQIKNVTQTPSGATCVESVNDNFPVS